MRGKARRLAALIETVENSVALWNQYDKWLEYFDSCWAHESDLDRSAENLQVYLRLTEYLISWFRLERVCDVAQLEEDLMRAIRTFASLSLTAAPTPDKILDLIPIAGSALREIDLKLSYPWFICECHDSHPAIEVVAQISLHLGLLESEMENTWSVISRGPLGLYNYPQKKAAKK